MTHAHAERAHDDATRSATSVHVACSAAGRSHATTIDARQRLDLLAHCAEAQFAREKMSDAAIDLVVKLTANREAAEQVLTDPRLLATTVSGSERTTSDGCAILSDADATISISSRVPAGAVQRTISWVLFGIMLSPTVAAIALLWRAFEWTRRLHPAANLAAVAMALPVAAVLGLLVLAGCQTLAQAVTLRAFVQQTTVRVAEKRRRLRYRWNAARQQFALDPSLHEIVVCEAASGYRALLPVTSAEWETFAPAQPLDAWCAPGAEQPFVLSQAHLQNHWSLDLTSPSAAVSFAWFAMIQLLFGMMLVFAMASVRTFAHL